MRSATWLRRAGWLGAFAITFCAIPTAGADEPPKGKVAAQEKSDDLGPARELVPRVKRRVVIAQDLIDDIRHGDYQFSPGKYTLKLSLSGVPKSLDAQLQLNGEGALVNSVAEGGPADKAGLKVHDILVAVADEPIEKITAVIEAVNESEGKELSFKVLRAGEPITITIKPEEIRNRIGIQERYVAEGEKAAEAAKEATRKVEIELRELEEKIREKLKDAGVDVRMQVIQPGRFVPRGLSWIIEKPADFPEDLIIDVHKQGKEPAKIEVKQGDKSWTVTDDKLDDLPEDVRKHAETLLGRGGARYSIVVPNAIVRPKLSTETRERAQAVAAEARERAKGAADAARDRAAQLRERLGDRLELRLDEMSREMKQMRERMEELRRSLREPADRDAGDDKKSGDDTDKGDDT